MSEIAIPVDLSENLLICYWYVSRKNWNINEMTDTNYWWPCQSNVIDLAFFNGFTDMIQIIYFCKSSYEAKAIFQKKNKK